MSRTLNILLAGWSDHLDVIKGNVVSVLDGDCRIRLLCPARISEPCRLSSSSEPTFSSQLE